MGGRHDYIHVTAHDIKRRSLLLLAGRKLRVSREAKDTRPWSVVVEQSLPGRKGQNTARKSRQAAVELWEKAG